MCVCVWHTCKHVFVCVLKGVIFWHSFVWSKKVVNLIIWDPMIVNFHKFFYCYILWRETESKSAEKMKDACMWIWNGHLCVCVCVSACIYVCVYMCGKESEWMKMCVTMCLFSHVCKSDTHSLSLLSHTYILSFIYAYICVCVSMRERK